MHETQPKPEATQADRARPTCHRNWAQIKPLEQDKIFVGCLCCSSAAKFAHIDNIIGVGFGDAYVTRDGECIYSEQNQVHEGKDDLWTVRDAEQMAAADPDHDWRITYVGALHGETYQRHKSGPHAGKWVCIQSDQGFA